MLLAWFSFQRRKRAKRRNRKRDRERNSKIPDREQMSKWSSSKAVLPKIFQLFGPHFFVTSLAFRFIFFCLLAWPATNLQKQPLHTLAHTHTLTGRFCCCSKRSPRFCLVVVRAACKIQLWRENRGSSRESGLKNRYTTMWRHKTHYNEVIWSHQET